MAAPKPEELKKQGDGMTSRKSMLVLAITLQQAVIVSAWADTGSDSDIIELDSIVVTGEKITRPLEETLSSVQVVTSENIREHGDQDLENVLMRTPGVYSQSGNENWGIRGVPVSGFDEQGAGTMNGAVTVFVDDAAQAHRLVTLNPMSLWDVEQVEIFRGSQSTNQGRNSLAGAVVVKTNDPSYVPEFAVQSNVGNYGERGASFLANGALVDGLAAARLAVDYQRDDGYIRNETLGEDANELRSLNVRGKLLVQPTDQLDLLFILAHTEERSGSNAVSVGDDGKPDYFSLYYNTEELGEVEQDTASVKANYYLNDVWTLTSITTSTWFDYTAVLDFDQSPDRVRRADRLHKQRLTNEELRLAYEGDDLTGFVGLYYGIHTNDINDQISLRLDGVDDPALVADGDIRIRNTALFGELDWEFVEDWQLHVGLRYDREKNETEFNYIDPLGFATVTSADESKSFDELLPKLGISYQISDDHLVGLEWKRGYRGGGVDLSTSTGHRPYDAETTDTYELAWRGAWLDNQLRTNLNVYYTDWTDQQVEIADENGIGFVSNAADSRMQGMEFSVDYSVTSSLDVFLGASYTDTEFKDFVLDGQDLSGTAFPFAPETKVTLGALYDFGNGLRVGSDIIHQSDSFTLGFDDNDRVIERPNDSITLVNLNAYYRLSPFISMTAYTKNLFDERYITNNQGDDILDVGAPRSYGVALRYDF